MKNFFALFFVLALGCEESHKPKVVSEPTDSEVLDAGSTDVEPPDTNPPEVVDYEPCFSYEPVEYYYGPDWPYSPRYGFKQAVCEINQDTDGTVNMTLGGGDTMHDICLASCNDTNCYTKCISDIDMSDADILVVHFVAEWCYYCMLELDEFQMFADIMLNDYDLKMEEYTIICGSEEEYKKVTSEHKVSNAVYDPRKTQDSWDYLRLTDRWPNSGSPGYPGNYFVNAKNMKVLISIDGWIDVERGAAFFGPVLNGLLDNEVLGAEPVYWDKPDAE